LNSVATIIPVHTYNKLVIKAIYSALNQDYDNNKVFVVINTTEDDLQHRLEIEFKNRIEIIYIEKLGVSYARNSGINKSESKYIAFLDSDDVWTKDKLASQINFMEENNYQISGALMKYTTSEVVSKYNVGAYRMDQSGIKAAKRMPFPISSLVLDRSVISNQKLFSENLGTNDYGQIEDLEFISRLANEYEIAVFLYNCGEYFINPDGATQKDFIKQRSAAKRLSSLRKSGRDEFINNFEYKIEKNNRIYSEMFAYRFMISNVNRSYFKSVIYFMLALVFNPVGLIGKLLRR
tara:strand:- start:315 stop:1193 length:879 start_codon:yes stop_codon:yes gene_type:complete